MFCIVRILIASLWCGAVITNQLWGQIRVKVILLLALWFVGCCNQGAGLFGGVDSLKSCREFGLFRLLGGLFVCLLGTPRFSGGCGPKQFQFIIGFWVWDAQTNQNVETAIFCQFEFEIVFKWSPCSIAWGQYQSGPFVPSPPCGGGSCSWA